MKNNRLCKSDSVVQIFTRTPEIGKCKTRLAKITGEQAAATIQAHMLGYILQVLEVGNFYDVQIWYTGSASYLKTCLSIPVYQQQGESLGSRMQFAMQHALQNYTKSIIIGSDCIGISVNTIQQAIVQLDTHDVVIAPALDGGYTLIGSKCANLSAFNLATWGDESVYEQTLQAMHADNLGIDELAAQIDVDTHEDLVQAFNTIPDWKEYYNKNNNIEFKG